MNDCCIETEEGIFCFNYTIGDLMDKQIRKLEKEEKKVGKGLKSLEKADKKRDKVCKAGEMAMKKKKKK